jgi:pimeloyl-ACP methyl ester carboxylesterase
MIGRMMALACTPALTAGAARAEMAGAAQVLIPGSKRVVVIDSGHLMQLEHPREVAELIADFVRKGR